MANHKYQTSNELSAAATKRNSAHMLPVSDWLSDLPENTQLTDLIEVQFKNTRKGYFHNSAHLPLEKGVKVVVEANPVAGTLKVKSEVENMPPHYYKRSECTYLRGGKRAPKAPDPEND